MSPLRHLILNDIIIFFKPIVALHLFSSLRPRIDFSKKKLLCQNTHLKLILEYFDMHQFLRYARIKFIIALQFVIINDFKFHILPTIVGLETRQDI